MKRPLARAATMVGVDCFTIDSALRAAAPDVDRELEAGGGTMRRRTTPDTARRYAQVTIVKRKGVKKPLEQADSTKRNKEMEYCGAWAGYVAGLRWFAIRAGMPLSDANLAEWRARGIDVKPLGSRMQGPEPLAWPVRGDRIAGDEAWARKHLWDRSPKEQTPGLPLLVAPMYRGKPWAAGPAKRLRYTKMLEVLGYWVETARADRVKIAVGKGGLGMWCVRKTYASRAEPYVLARAHFVNSTADISTGLVIDTVHGQRGMVLGPAGTANAGCRAHCNADFRVRGGVLELHAGCEGNERAIEAGAQILIRQHPPAGATWYCPECNRPID